MDGVTAFSPAGCKVLSGIIMRGEFNMKRATSATP